MSSLCAVALIVFLGCLSSFEQDDYPDAKNASIEGNNGYVPVSRFDPRRNAGADIRAAITEAQRTGKRILLDIGGDWCQYCHQMEQFFEEHPDVLQLRDKNFITVAVFYSSSSKNDTALARYSKVLGIPHFFVLEKDGTLLHSQHVAELRKNGKYSPDKMKDFLTKWAPAEDRKKHEN